MAKSPSITILERDMSAYKVTSSDTVLAVVGYATKGPIGIPTLVTSRSDFNAQFGTTVVGSPYAALAAYRAFNQGNKIIFYRVATTATAKVNTDVGAIQAEIIVKNVAPETYASMDIETSITPLTTTQGVGDTVGYEVKIIIDGITYDVTATSDGSSELAVATIVTAIESAIGENGTVDLTGTTITVTSATNGVTGAVSIIAGDTDDLLSLTGVSSLNQVAGTNSGDSTDNVQIISLEKGSSANLISVVKETRINPVTGSDVYKIEVYYDGVLKESFDDISFTVADTNFFKTIINADFDNGGSNLIAVDYDDTAVDPLVVEFQDGTYTLGTGTIPGTTILSTILTTADDFTAYDHVIGRDGYDSEATAGANEELFTAALLTTGELGNMEAYDYHILITPDMPEQAVQDAAIELAEFRKDFIYVVDSPMGLAYDEVVEWHNGTGGHGRVEALDSSYAVLYWSWLKDYNSDSKEYVWCPPSVFVAEKLMEVDRLYGPWFAPAGDLRGKITAADYESSPSFAQREVLYGDFNAVNPIVNFVSKGLEIYGQKTLIRENVALNRINVRRMIIFAKKLIKKALESIIFEPHNPDSWRKASNLVTAILEPIRQAGGIDKYSVIIDDTVNTPDVIAQNVMKGTIKIIPMNTIEIVEITMQVHKSGASLDE